MYQMYAISFGQNAAPLCLAETCIASRCSRVQLSKTYKLKHLVKIEALPGDAAALSFFLVCLSPSLLAQKQLLCKGSL